MNVSIETETGRVPVTVMKISGDVDASSYRALIQAAREQHAAGTRHILLDLGEVGYMGSSGLMALHSIAVLVRGQEPPDPEAGWRAFRTMGRDVEAGPQAGVKLLNPQPSVRRVLETSGMAQFLEIYTDRAAAIDAF